jgi:hypothetical protein
MRIPTLRTIKKAAIANIDGSCAIDVLKGRSFAVKEIPLSGLNFPPRDDFEQHLDGVQSVVLISR